jgi:hypothetical protein
MSFDTIKSYLVDLIQGLGYRESGHAFDFQNASPNEYGKTFILTMDSGALEDPGDKLSLRFMDTQKWRVQIAFEKSEHSDVVNRDKMYREIENIIKAIDDPDNWLNTIRFMRYESWETEPLENYVLLTINLIVDNSIEY